MYRQNSCRNNVSPRRVDRILQRTNGGLTAGQRRELRSFLRQAVLNKGHSSFHTNRVSERVTRVRERLGLRPRDNTKPKLSEYSEGTMGALLQERLDQLQVYKQGNWDASPMVNFVAMVQAEKGNDEADDMRAELQVKFLQNAVAIKYLADHCPEHALNWKPNEIQKDYIQKVVFDACEEKPDAKRIEDVTLDTELLDGLIQYVSEYPDNPHVSNGECVDAFLQAQIPHEYKKLLQLGTQISLTLAGGKLAYTHLGLLVGAQITIADLESVERHIRDAVDLDLDSWNPIRLNIKKMLDIATSLNRKAKNRR